MRTHVSLMRREDPGSFDCDFELQLLTANS